MKTSGSGAISVAERPGGRSMWAQLERLTSMSSSGPSTYPNRAMYGPIRVTVAPDGTHSVDLKPALIAVAHGSRDPRSAATMSAVVAELAAARPDLDVRLAFLDLSTPSVGQVVDAVAAQGHTHAVVIPLLLGSAFHARVDLPGLLAAAQLRHPQLHFTQADVLGPDPRLISALRDRVLDACGRPTPARTQQLANRADDASAAASITPKPRSDRSEPASDRPGQRGVGPDMRPERQSDRSTFARDGLAARLDRTQHRSGRRLGVAVAAVGSTSAAANSRTAAVAQRLSALTGWRTEICFATAEPSITQAVSRLRDRGADRILVAPWFLAPGLLTDRLLAAASDVTHTNVIGSHAALTAVALDRYDAAVDSALLLSA